MTNITGPGITNNITGTDDFTIDLYPVLNAVPYIWDYKS